MEKAKILHQQMLGEILGMIKEKQKPCDRASEEGEGWKNTAQKTRQVAGMISRGAKANEWILLQTERSTEEKKLLIRKPSRRHIHVLNFFPSVPLCRAGGKEVKSRFVQIPKGCLSKLQDGYNVISISFMDGKSWRRRNSAKLLLYPFGSLFLASRSRNTIFLLCELPTRRHIKIH